MFDETHILELLPAYALESLEEAEAQRVAEHLNACHLCRMELRAYQELAGQLALLVPEASPSPEVRARLQQKVQGWSPARGRPDRQQPSRQPLFGRLIPVSAIMGLVLIIVLLTSNIMLWQRLNHLDVLSGPLGMRAVVLQNTAAAPHSSGFVIISADGQNGVLVVDELPMLAADREYQLWLVRGEEILSAAVFNVDETGYRGLRIEAPESLLTYSAVRVTVEPVGGSASPAGEEVLKGSLFNP